MTARSPLAGMPVILSPGFLRAGGSARPFPMDLLERHAPQAQANHGQTLTGLAVRGGLAPSEILAILEDRPWTPMADGAALMRLSAVLAAEVRAWLPAST